MTAMCAKSNDTSLLVPAFALCVLRHFVSFAFSGASPANQVSRDHKDGEYAGPGESNILWGLNGVAIGVRYARVGAWQRAFAGLRRNSGLHCDNTLVAIVDDEVHAWTLNGRQPQGVRI